MKMNKKALAIFAMAITSLTMVNTAHASDRTMGEIYQQCGLGGMIFAGAPTAAAISNILWDLGTTAVSSDASSEDSCVTPDAQSAAFIYDSYTILEQNIAKGEGEHFSALLDIMSCNEDARSNVLTQVRTDFTETVSAEDYSDASELQKAEALYNIMNSSAVTASCSA